MKEYGRLTDGRLERIRPTSILLGGQRVFNPSEAQLARVGIYPIDDVQEDGDDCVKHGRIQHYLGALSEGAVVEDERTYEERVVALIRERYSVDDELALLRQRDVKVDEFAAYNEYCEACKQKAKQG